MRASSFGATFANIDASNRGEDLIRYLDWVARLSSVRAAKQGSVELLDLRAGDRLLDVGCGTGDDIRSLNERVAPGGRIVGVDSSRLVVEEATRRARDRTSVEFIVADTADLPFGDGEFHAVRADRTLQHVSDPDRAIAEIGRVMSPRGRLVVSEMLNELHVDGAIDESEPAVAVRDRFWSRSERGGWLGPLLPLLLHRNGFSNIRLVRSDETVSDFSSIDGLFRLSELADEAVRERALTHAAASKWLLDLASRASEGRVVVKLHFLHVVSDRRDDGGSDLSSAPGHAD